jgi:2-polyprenyl-3-methyl-5-hydroxy-6-metoxy-1,4-benzoquinol methylase
MTVNYDPPVYKKWREKSIRHQYVDEYLYFNMIGELSGKSVLDLGCGEGTYTRIFRKKGAAQVTGADLSEGLIRFARQEEAAEPLGIEYIVGDVAELGEIGSFDLVTASYLLNHASDKETLLKICQTIFVNLKSGGRFLSITGDHGHPPETYPLCRKYGYMKSTVPPLREGSLITITFLLDDETCTVEDYYLSRETYEWAFREAGFEKVLWHEPVVSPEGLEKFGEAFWDDYISYPFMCGIECLKISEKC